MGGAARRRRRRAPARQFDDPISIQYTSGTTGLRKGATLSHHNILNNGYFIGEGCGYSARDRVCIPVPFYHCFGMVLGNLACTTHGACTVTSRQVGEARGKYSLGVRERHPGSLIAQCPTDVARFVPHGWAAAARGSRWSTTGGVGREITVPLRAAILPGSESVSLLLVNEQVPGARGAVGRAGQPARGVSDAGRFPHLDEPLRFVSLLTEFMETTEPAQIRVGGWEELRGHSDDVATVPLRQRRSATG